MNTPERSKYNRFVQIISQSINSENNHKGKVNNQQYNLNGIKTGHKLISAPSPPIENLVSVDYVYQYVSSRQT